jgi:hypothetical protein
MNAPIDPARFSSPASHHLGPKQIEEQRLLEGPQSRFKELMRAFRIFSECLHGFRKLHFVPLATKKTIRITIWLAKWAPRSLEQVLR